MAAVIAARLARRWRGRPVLVVGDLLLDAWLEGTASRVCREAPIPVIDIVRTEESCGGAANTAVNLAALGAAPVLVGAVGDDPAAARLRASLWAAGVRAELVEVPGRRTVCKSRVLANGQVVARFDAGDTGPLPPAAVAVMLRRISRLLSGVDALVVCDYGTGSLADARDWLAARRSALPFVAVDAHDPARWRRVRPALVTPSFAEVRGLLRPPPGPAPGGPTGTDRAALLSTSAAQVLAGTGAGIAAVTLDVDGALVLRQGEQPYRTYSRPVPASHTAGAGDAYCAAFTLALLAGSPATVAADLAQRAAVVAADRQGTCVCRLDALLDGEPAPACPEPYQRAVAGSPRRVAPVGHLRAAAGDRP